MSFDPTTIVKPFPPRADVGGLEPGFTRLESLVDPVKLRRQYLFGMKLKSTITNQELSDDDLKDFITRAISRIEHEARIAISPVKYLERFDYNIWDYTKFNWIQLNHWPVLQIESVMAKYPNTEAFIQYPAEWISCYNETGTFQMVPTQGAITQFLITNDASLLPLVLGGRANWPQLWQVAYTSGFEQDKTPAFINDLIGLYATIPILEMLNSITFLGSYGIGIDGVSQSVSLPGPGWLDGRINQLNERAAASLDTIKRFYNNKLIVGVL